MARKLAFFAALLVSPASGRCQFANVEGATPPRDATHATHGRRRADDSGKYVHSTGCDDGGDDCVVEMSLELCASTVWDLSLIHI